MLTFYVGKWYSMLANVWTVYGVVLCGCLRCVYCSYDHNRRVRLFCAGAWHREREKGREGGGRERETRHKM
jgi:hypothetical protein